MTDFSWKQLEAHLSKERWTQFKEISSTPSQFTFHKRFLFFLGIPRNDLEGLISCVNTLLYINLDAKEQSTDDRRSLLQHEFESNFSMGTDSSLSDDGFEKQLEENDELLSYKWETLLEFDPLFCTDQSGNPNYSKEEELLRERKRMSAHGITSYEFHHDSGRILFAAGNSLFWVDINDLVDGKCKHVASHEVFTNLSGTRMDAKICHRNSDLISFVYSGDIWVSNIATGQELRLTFARTPGLDDSVSAGVPAFVTQEEFDRFSGYWWEPAVKSTSDEDEIEVHRILYELVDESMVAKHHIVSTMDDFSTRVDSYRYPKAGSKNAQSSLRLIQFSILKETKEILDGSIHELELRVELNDLIPWAEYLVRCEWMGDGLSIWAQLLNRRQNRLALIRIPMSAFRFVSSSCVQMQESHFKIEIILEEMSEIWINLSDIIHFLPSSNSSTTKLIWSSEKFGYRHLFLITVRNSPSNNTRNESILQRLQENNLHICDTLSCAQLTEGQWEVSSSKIWVDEQNQLIYFSGRRETPLEEHLYVTSYQFGCEVKRLTESDFYHAAHLNQDCNLLVTVSSSITALNQVQVFKIDKTDSRPGELLPISLQPFGWIERPRALNSNLSSEFFSYTNNRGFTVYGLMVRRNDLDENQKHPTVLFVYGGPGVQLVTNSQKVLRRSGLHSVTSLGYIAVIIDTMGSYHRGIEFEALLKDSMGTVEVDEQVEGLQFIAEKSGCIDMERVAVHGWSYGGYLSLMGLAQRPDIFKVAIAGAPVISWKLYDTGYTERYMDLPEKNPSGYKNGSVLEYVRKFPNEHNRLLIVHGLIDENVHFSHTDLLINQLIKKGKPYSIQIFPNERHGIRHSSSAQHFETTFLMFLQENL